MPRWGDRFKHLEEALEQEHRKNITQGAVRPSSNQQRQPPTTEQQQASALPGRGEGE